ncbi:hypothetical protein [Halothiobacillus sp.]|jgi:hypothetical protein|uniref:hypothetical protein n=1 Tax=Halothiobacillus sp. TaxID=1891311 RepID=UPI00260FC98F|nr:hypothetical protein [Halothiobacillus sp.]
MISKSADSIGLQVVDVYLWLANKMISGVELPGELGYLWSLFARRSSIDGISLDGMARRFKAFERLLPSLEDISDEQKQTAKELIEKHREKVRSLYEFGADLPQSRQRGLKEVPDALANLDHVEWGLSADFFVAPNKSGILSSRSEIKKLYHRSHK